MSYGIKLRVWGKNACFTRPEMKVERVSYDVMTPSSARGILEAIYWKPAIRWQIDSISVCKPIKFENIRRNELGGKLSIRNITTVMKSGQGRLETFIEEDRQQRATMALRDVEYIIEAHIEFSGNEDNNIGKHLDIFKRRAKNGQTFHQPCFGCREFPAHFELFEGGITPIDEDKDLGFMLYDMDYTDEKDIKPMFFRANINKGVVKVPSIHSGEVLR